MLPPTANAGADQSIPMPTTVSLSGTGSDTDGSISTYSWSQNSGETVSLTNASSSTATFESPVIIGGDTLVFTLTVTDNDGASAKDSVTINIASSSSIVDKISEITFSDANLSNCLSAAAATNNWQLINEVTELDCASSGIITLDGIENLTSLTELTLTDNQIIDITPIANLTGLTILGINVNQIVDISPVANLSALTMLLVGVNQITDIGPVANLTALTFLQVGENQITDISPVTNLNALTFLGFSANQVVDISPVANLITLKTLKINNNKIIDVSPLAGLNALAQLNLDNNQIIDITILLNILAPVTINLAGNENIPCPDLDSLDASFGEGIVARPSSCVASQVGDDILTGVFVDSPVEGLQWISGNMAGTTDVNGVFNYISGATVQFYVGDILIGEALGNSVIIPIDLVADAQDINHTTVINIVRFLMTLDDDNDAANGIKIVQAISDLALGVSVDFTQSTADFTGSGHIQTLISTFTAVTEAGPHALFSVLDALNHSENSIKDLLAGAYSGTFSGDNSGTWTGTLTTSGVLSGTATSSEVVSFLGTVSTNGSGTTDFKTSGGVSDGTTFSGTFNPNGNAFGTWNYFGEESGTWVGSKSN